MITGIALRRVLVSAGALTAIVLGACADERRDHPVFLDDLNDLDRFPTEDRRRLRSEHDQLPISVVRVSVDAKGEPRADARAEVRHLSGATDLQRLDGERMASAWSEGRSSDRVRLAHNARHVADDYSRGRRYSTQHDLDDHSYGHRHHDRQYRHHKRHERYHHRGHMHGHHYRYNRNYSKPLVYGYSHPTTYWYRYYQPYYRSHYYPNVYWGGYRFYNTYYQPRGSYRYYVYYPNTSYYRNRYYTY